MKWDYVVFRTAGTAEEDETSLGELGWDGWELVGGLSFPPRGEGRLYLKRPAPDAPPPAEEPAALLARAGKKVRASSSGEFLWWDGRRFGDCEDILPASVWDQTTGETRTGDGYKAYPTLEAAMKAAADAYRKSR